MVTVNQLPKEILIYILSLLNTVDQLECNRVNQHWHKIVSNDILYETISFNDNLQKLRDGNRFFGKREDLAKCVRHVEIKNFYAGNAIHLVAYFPHLFPNVNQLVWVDRQHRNGQPLERTYSFYLSNGTAKWKKLNHLKTTYFLYVLIRGGLINSSYYANLLDLDISFNDDTCLQGTPSSVKSLIEGLKDTPRLEKLSLVDCVFDFDDMEQLHEYCPKLKHLSLDNLYVRAQEEISIGGMNGKCLFNNEGVQLVKNPAESLVKMSVRFYTASNSPTFRIDNTKETIVKWLTYINCKYPHLDVLTLNASVSDGDELLAVTDIFEQPIINIISSSITPANYEILQLYPLTKKLVKEIDQQNCKLNKAYLQLGQQKDVQDYTDMIQGSKQMDHIHGLTIGTNGMMHLDSAKFKPFLLNVCCQLGNLVDLAFDANTHQGVLIDILHNLPMLQKLQFRFFQIGVDDNESFAVIKKTRIKELSLGVWSNERDNYTKINNALRFTLQSCPLLTEFSLSGAIYCGPGLLNLFFGDHDRLESARVHVDGIDYYTFDSPGDVMPELGYRGQKWLDHLTQLKEERIEQNAHLDVTFNKRIQFDLKSGLH